MEKEDNTSNHKKDAKHKQKMEFLLTTLDAVEKRRDAIENKITILMAANAILLSAIIVLGFSVFKPSTIYYVLFLQSTLTAFSLIFSILSVVFSILTIFQISQKNRHIFLDNVPENIIDEHNLFFFTRIGLYKKIEYQKEISNLTENEILNQITSEIHNVSKLVSLRYRKYTLVNIFFIIGLLFFSLLAILQLVVSII